MPGDRACINAPHLHGYLVIGAVLWFPLVAFLALSLLWLPAGTGNWLAAAVTLAGNLLAIGVALALFLHYQWTLCISSDGVSFGRWSEQIVRDRRERVNSQELRGIVIYDGRWVDIEVRSGRRMRLGTLLWRSRDLSALDDVGLQHGVRIERRTLREARGLERE